METLIVGTRGSELAVRQTDLIVTLLRNQNPDIEFEVRTLQTTGDRITDRPISTIGDKGIFVRPIERALLEGAIDIAVHSLKDVPADSETSGLEIAAYSAREDARDVLVSRSGGTLASLPGRAIIGTSSLRRRVQLGGIRPDVRAADIRGNVDTRLRKMDEGQYDAVLLAAAGLLRLGLTSRIAEYFPVDIFTPDAGQGILAVQVRAGDAAAGYARRIDDAESRVAGLTERAVVRALEAGCHSPVGAFATVVAEEMHLRAMAASVDGSSVYRIEESCPVAAAESLGEAVGKRLLALSGPAGTAYTGA